RDRLDAPDDPAGIAIAALSSGLTDATGGPDRRAAAIEFAALLDQIRGQAGFESFLLPPEPDELTRHAAQGPIAVFNISRYRSDVLLITTEAITHLPLPELNAQDVADKIDEFETAIDATKSTNWLTAEAGEDSLSEILEWLWDVAMWPVLRQLGHIDAHPEGQPWPQIWWVPGGLLSLLPLHAAGYHRQATGETVLDRVISSYTPTVRALAHARDRAPGRPPRRTLLVGMPTTPGESALPNVHAELSMLEESLPSPIKLIQQTNSAVVSELPNAEIAHFSCHGISNPGDPSNSMLLLEDHHENPFTVACLIPIQLQHAQLVYLSACETARNTAFELLDEAIHLASAFQLAGYPHVIGTLWTINDRLAVDVSRAFYAGLTTRDGDLDVSGSAEALHHAVRKLRTNWEFTPTPSRWAAYIHSGG
ncbi:MAG TPA: CHAT domain-containing protein, partial [Pseudonocardiaceae bacterium]|nr:CHAT domain-containing protein [Pseudonocardiaceae bacterium]